MLKHLVSAALVVLSVSPALADAPKTQAKIRVLIVDGQNNHDWRTTTPFMKKALEASGRFSVEVATTPQQPGGGPKKPKSDDLNEISAYKQALLDHEKKVHLYRATMSAFHPDLSKCDVVLSNYNGEQWGPAFKRDLDESVQSGRIGLVIVHAANNSFGGAWKEYNRMIGMGWYSPNVGPRLYLDDEGKEVLVPKGKGDGPGHRYSGPFSVVIRDASHPITKGMPREWMHARDELYDNMRGPIESIHLLATAYSKGTKVNEPMIWTVSYGKGRIFHTPMGHDVGAMHCIGFITTLQRGTEWAATGSVTIPIPDNFPTATRISTIAK
jgi:type 1 glutamine amidotransferase